jgi:membrane protein YdbS with pleckstrin-like domain
MAYILNAQEQPFSDADAAKEKARILTSEIGVTYESIPNPEGDGFVVIRKGNGQVKTIVQAQADDESDDLPVMKASREMGKSQGHDDFIPTVKPILRKNIVDDDTTLSGTPNNLSPDVNKENTQETEDGLDVDGDDNISRFLHIASQKNYTQLDSDKIKKAAHQGKETKQTDIENKSKKDNEEDYLSPVDIDCTEDGLTEKNLKWRGKYPPLTFRPSFRSFWALYILFVACALVYIDPKILWGAFMTADDAIHGNVILRVFPQAVYLMSIAGMIYAMLKIFVKWFSYKYVIKDRKIESRFGIIKRHFTSVMLSDIKTARLRQGVMGRMLGYGDVLVATAGTADEDVVISNVNDPVKIQHIVNKRKEAALSYWGSAGE